MNNVNKIESKFDQTLVNNNLYDDEKENGIFKFRTREKNGIN
jgi:hypothetical protein